MTTTSTRTLAFESSTPAPAERSSPSGRPVILVLLGAFWPGHEATGPNQSFRSFALALNDEFEFKIIARDRPFGARRPLAPSGEWVDRGFALFRYCTISAARGARGLGEILRATPHDLLMMNGFFDREFTIPALLLRRRDKAPRCPAILSTRGEFADGALGLKSLRKHIYLKLAHHLGLVEDVWLHATGTREAEDVRNRCPFARGILVAPNIRQIGGLPAPGASPTHPPARSSSLRLVFLGRIARVKNLAYALEVLKEVRSPVTFDIYGPIQEAGYWQECRAIIAKLPPHVSVNHKGEIANSQVPETLARYELFFLPTHGENFGHAILDALSAGVPVLISDRTPFLDLELKRAGWSLPLDARGAYVAAIDAFAGFDRAGRARLEQGARSLAEQVVKESDAVSRSRAMIRRAFRSDAASHGLH
ncbi:Glycosyltransferase involved in cell wall bisynthesis [Rhizobiales bacterium GAS191]|nr:Glycosyltransferase involved in cell wall bisynthesis [Rhizobiales bacterium GAS191]